MNKCHFCDSFETKFCKLCGKWFCSKCRKSYRKRIQELVIEKLRIKRNG